MRLTLSLPVLVVLLAVVLEGPAPAQAELSIPDSVKNFGSTVEKKILDAVDHIKKSDLPKKTWTWISETFSKARDKLKTTFS
ncbi:apolipoprotein C-I [Molossus molossus]|uniref:Apolipoprotein C-I n=1 Tax=Molossus molossus TaxID=27622 RepID=A0A7J8C5G3_MOLMO|nr:apolipoprotein C-I [Molossus molossus]KAF6406104.1 apolipoprotein C1 [Molossus molossus]